MNNESTTNDPRLPVGANTVKVAGHQVAVDEETGDLFAGVKFADSQGRYLWIEINPKTDRSRRYLMSILRRSGFRGSFRDIHTLNDDLSTKVLDLNRKFEAEVITDEYSGLPEIKSIRSLSPRQLIQSEVVIAEKLKELISQN